jgi:diacylglycerol O-acyltransferase / wax synthase
MEQLSGQDAMFVYMDRDLWASHAGFVILYDPSTAPGGQVRLRDIVNHVESRLGASKLFRRRLVRVPLDLDNPYWVEDERFDVEFHIRHIRLPEPGDWRQLCIQLARIQARPIDLSKPPWEMWVIEGLDNVEGVPKGTYAIFTKAHHAAVDGHGATDIISGLHDLSPVTTEREQPAWKPESRPRDTALMGRAVINNVVRGPLRVGRLIPELLSRIPRPGGDSTPSPLPAAVEHTRFQDAVSPHRSFEGTPFRLQDIKDLRALVEDSTVNDVVLSIVSGAMHTYLASKGETPAGPLVSGTPVDMRKGQAATEGNDILIRPVEIAANIADPVERLKQIQRNTAELKHSAKGARHLTELSTEFPGALFAWSTKALMSARIGWGTRRPFYNLGISNVPGPRVPLYMNGARAVRIFFVGPCGDGCGIIWGANSYEDELMITFCSCRDMVPDPEFLIACVQQSFAEMQARLTPANGRPPALIAQ